MNRLHVKMGAEKQRVLLSPPSFLLALAVYLLYCITLLYISVLMNKRLYN